MKRILLLVLFGLSLATPAEALLSQGDFGCHGDHPIAHQFLKWYEYVLKNTAKIGILAVDAVGSGSILHVDIHVVRIENPVHDSSFLDVLEKVYPVIETEIGETPAPIISWTDLRERETAFYSFAIPYHPALEEERLVIRFKSHFFRDTTNEEDCTVADLSESLLSVDCTVDIGPCRRNNPTPVICERGKCAPATPVPALPVVGLGLLGLLTLAGGIRLTRRQ